MQDTTNSTTTVVSFKMFNLSPQQRVIPNISIGVVSHQRKILAVSSYKIAHKESISCGGRYLKKNS